MSMTEHTQGTATNHTEATVSRGANPGRGYTIGGAVCAVVALLFLPIAFGPIGAVLGFVGYAKGDKAGLWVGIAAIACGFIGMVLGAMVLNNAGNT